MHFVGFGSFYNSGRLVDRSPCREHIVNQQNIHSLNQIGAVHLEGSLDIFISFTPCFFGLRFGHLHPSQQSDSHQEIENSRYLLGDEKRLIESPLFHFSEMEGNGRNIKAFERFIQSLKISFDQQFGFGQCSKLPLIFEMVNHLLQDQVIGTH